MARGARPGPDGQGGRLAGPPTSLLSANRTASSPAYATASATGPPSPGPVFLWPKRHPGDLGARGLGQPSALLGGEPLPGVRPVTRAGQPGVAGRAHPDAVHGLAPGASRAGPGNPDREPGQRVRGEREGQVPAPGHADVADLGPGQYRPQRRGQHGGDPGGIRRQAMSQHERQRGGITAGAATGLRRHRAPGAGQPGQGQRRGRRRPVRPPDATAAAAAAARAALRSPMITDEQAIRVRAAGERTALRPGPASGPLVSASGWPRRSTIPGRQDGPGCSLGGWLVPLSDRGFSSVWRVSLVAAPASSRTTRIISPGSNGLVR